ncbi:AMP-binding protein [Gracilimonas mengyeensis]|uniref:Long-chain-fatty-acid--CoA ligase n=1 Tax=Gracilimonas mengyeensis TaxID=1302730 RepID=A0A521FIE5_9BACT|nr:AMP-binding protein [Gracilimonas mengyeensis]SMO95915.1 AMP-binding enzyme C-terminal domain-containing protein [Gracilimonas mengyeensis]
MRRIDRALTNFWDHIVAESERPLVVTAGEALYHSDFLRIRTGSEHVLLKLRGKAVAISGTDAELIHLLLLLDGTASSILLLPNDMQTDQKEEFFGQCGIEAEATLVGEELEVNKIPASSETLKLSDTKGGRTDWIIPTSGTSGTPKLVAHNLKSLTRTTKFNREVGRDIRWGLSYSISRFAGIQIMLQSLLSGSTLLVASPEASFSEKADFFATNHCNAISATPTFWRKLLMVNHESDLNLKVITLGGEIADQQILNALSKKYPEARITHIYASTEAGVGFAVRDHLEGFPAAFVRDGVEGAELKIEQDGTLRIKPHTANQKFISTDIDVDADGFIDTGDLVEEKSDRYVFLGRRSGSINVGGNKVMPEEVENLLLKSGLLKGVKVYGKANPIMGNLVSADVIPNSASQDQKILKKELKSYCSANIESFKRPAFFKVVSDFDLNASGKISRN